jgi:integrase
VLLNVGMTKNGTPRLIPVPPKARWALAYLPFKFGSRYYYERIRKVLDAAGLDELVPHDGRHVVATDILLHGGTLPTCRPRCITSIGARARATPTW